MTPDDEFHVYDTTLRDGAQQEGLTSPSPTSSPSRGSSTSSASGFIEGGWPGAIPKDTEFFAGRAPSCSWRTRSWPRSARPAGRRDGGRRPAGRRPARVRRAGGHPGRQVPRPARRAGAAHHARREPRDGRATPSSHLRAEGRRVFLDAEHFFDGYRADPAYALEVVRTAAEAGADVVVLCDTNGGMLPDRDRPTSSPRSPPPPARGSASTATTTPPARSPTPSPRSTPAPRTSRAPPTATASGPATPTCSPSSPAWSSSRAARCCPTGCLREMSRVAHADRRGHQPDPGHPPALRRACPPSPTRRACTPSAVKVDPMLYQHIDPALVGNDMRMLVSDMAGRASSSSRAGELGFDLAGDQARSAGSSSGSRTGRPRATPSRPPTPPSSCCCATSWRGERLRHFDGRVVAGHRRAAPGRRGAQRGHREAARQGRADRRHRRGQRPGQRARPGAARWRWSGSTPSWPGSSWPTTRSASWRARTAPAPSPAS